MQRLVGVRQRQQAVGVHAAERGPAQVFGHERGLEGAAQVAQALKVISVERVDRADRQAHAVQAQAMVATHAFEEMARFAAAAKVVLAVDLDEGDGWARAEEFDVMRGAQADAGAAWCARERGRG